MIVREEFGTAGAQEKLNPTDATGVTAALEKPTSGRYAGNIAIGIILTVETYPIRFRLDGTAPDADTGHKVDPGQNITIIGSENVINFQCIDTAAGASDVFITVFY